MRRLFVATALALPLWAQAQGPTGILLPPGGAVVNEPVKVVIDFAAAQRWCGLRVDFGDGDVSDVLVEDFPLTIIRRYAAPGRYVLRAEGRLLLRGISSSPGCTGAKRSAVITVADSTRNAQPSRLRKGDQRESDERDEESQDSDDRRRDRQGRKERADREDREERGERGERENREGRERNAHDQRPERGSRSDRSRDSDAPPARAPTPAATQPAREPRAVAEPARGPAPRSRPPRDESLKVF